jgi:hypothetical protein
MPAIASLEDLKVKPEKRFDCLRYALCAMLYAV